MSTEWWLLALRLGVIFVIFLFVLQIGLILRRDLLSRGHAEKVAIVQDYLSIMEEDQTSFSPSCFIELTAVNSLGRSEENSIHLTDESVSAKHALLSYRQKRWWLKDLDSTNGTFVNQQPIVAETPLTHGDVIEIGNIKLRLERPRTNA